MGQKFKELRLPDNCKIEPPRPTSSSARLARQHFENLFTSQTLVPQQRLSNQPNAILLRTNQTIRRRPQARDLGRNGERIEP